MKKKLFIVMYCDRGESCDYKPRIQGVYKTKEEAYQNAYQDMDSYIGSLDEECDYNADRNNLSVQIDENDTGCEWAVEEVEVDLD